MQPKLRSALRVAAGAVTSAGSQNFLGAQWVSAVPRLVPPAIREQTALLLLSISPHYFYGGDRMAEAERARTTREVLVRDLLDPFLDRDTVALDFGCGPGYMAAAVARLVREVEAVDVSPGVLACARVLNGAPNISYETPDQAGRRNTPVDVVYSFAVVQHLTDTAFGAALALIRRRLRPGGTLILHFAAPVDGWRSEAQWRADSSVSGRAKLRFGLNCFGRSAAAMESMVVRAGFAHVRIEPLTGRTSADDDIARQHWLLASD
ncbi:MAG: putative S-adenosyl-L-methionine-dependent methyltransferase [Dactylosporangium sp.]|jgi:SAM-dependent methyltransferase|nr:putative S-adenosyl-L-methionine-dependent methyltransferase [Dactylosporangium sp.]